MSGMFIPLRKVDAARQMVFGWIDETPDHSREILDYNSAKPAFEKWSADQATASKGKSYGNVRAMHQKVSAGIIPEPIIYNDAEKRIEFWAKIVDSAEWEKCVAGAYTGFSPGGGYAKTWPDPTHRGHRRYTPIVLEMSLVDKACIPSASFQLIKADGVIEERQFETALADYEPTRDEIRELAGELAKAAGTPDRTNDHVTQARADLIGRHAALLAEQRAAAGAEAPADDETMTMIKAARPELSTEGAQACYDEILEKFGKGEGESLQQLAKDWSADPAADLEAAIVEADKALEKADDGKEGKYGDVVYADTKNKKYPVDTAKHIKAAWSYINMPKNQKGYTSAEVATIKRKIVAAWKEKIDKDGPPSAEKIAALVAAFTPESIEAFAAAIEPRLLMKGVYNLGWIASLLEEVNCLRSCLTTESALEGDNSPAPSQAEGIVEGLAALLVQQAQEECAELLADMRDEPEESPAIMELSAHVEAPLLEKVGKRNSSADAARIQGIHDHSVSLGASCDSEEETAEKVAGAQALAKLANLEDTQAELARARRTMAAAIPDLRELTKTVSGLKAEIAQITTDKDAQIADLTQQIEQLAKSAAPPKGKLITHGKAEDTDDLKLEKTAGATFDVNDPTPPEDPDVRAQWALERRRRGVSAALPAPGGGARF